MLLCQDLGRRDERLVTGGSHLGSALRATTVFRSTSPLQGHRHLAIRSAPILGDRLTLGVRELKGNDEQSSSRRVNRQASAATATRLTLC